MNLNIGRRISEEGIVDEISTIYYQNMDYWPSTYCNETDIMLNANKIQTNIIDVDINVSRSRIKTRFNIIVKYITVTLMILQKL